MIYRFFSMFACVFISGLLNPTCAESQSSTNESLKQKPQSIPDLIVCGLHGDDGIILSKPQDFKSFVGLYSTSEHGKAALKMLHGGRQESLKGVGLNVLIRLWGQPVEKSDEYVSFEMSGIDTLEERTNFACWVDIKFVNGTPVEYRIRLPKSKLDWHKIE